MNRFYLGLVGAITAFSISTFALDQKELQLCNQDLSDAQAAADETISYVLEMHRGLPWVISQRELAVNNSSNPEIKVAYHSAQTEITNNYIIKSHFKDPLMMKKVIDHAQKSLIPALGKWLTLNQVGFKELQTNGSLSIELTGEGTSSLDNSVRALKKKDSQLTLFYVPTLPISTAAEFDPHADRIYVNCFSLLNLTLHDEVSLHEIHHFHKSIWIKEGKDKSFIGLLRPESDDSFQGEISLDEIPGWWISVRTLARALDFEKGLSNSDLLGTLLSTISSGEEKVSFITSVLEVASHGYVKELSTSGMANVTYEVRDKTVWGSAKVFVPISDTPLGNIYFLDLPMMQMSSADGDKDNSLFLGAVKKAYSQSQSAMNLFDQAKNLVDQIKAAPSSQQAKESILKLRVLTRTKTSE